MIRRLLVAAGVATVLLVPVEPAHAHTEACVFEGTMVVSSPGPGPVNWWMGMSIGACTSGGWFSAAGDMTISPIGTMTGTGVTNTGHRFGFTGTNAVFYLAGEVTGTWTGSIDPTTTGGHSAIIVADLLLVH